MFHQNIFIDYIIRVALATVLFFVLSVISAIFKISAQHISQSYKNNIAHSKNNIAQRIYYEERADLVIKAGNVLYNTENLKELQGSSKYSPIAIYLRDKKMKKLVKEILGKVECTEETILELGLILDNDGRLDPIDDKMFMEKMMLNIKNLKSIKDEDETISKIRSSDYKEHLEKDLKCMKILINRIDIEPIENIENSTINNTKNHELDKSFSSNDGDPETKIEDTESLEENSETISL